MAASAALAIVTKMMGMRSIDAPNLAVDLQAGLVGEVEVEQDDVRPSRPGAFEPLGPGRGHLDPVRRCGERPDHRLQARSPIVVDEQQVGHDFARCGDDRARTLRSTGSSGTRVVRRRSPCPTGQTRVSSCAPFAATQRSVVGGQLEPGIAMARTTID